MIKTILTTTDNQKIPVFVIFNHIRDHETKQHIGTTCAILVDPWTDSEIDIRDALRDQIGNTFDYGYNLQQRIHADRKFAKNVVPFFGDSFAIEKNLEGILYLGVAYRSPRDNFNRKEGRERAFERALDVAEFDKDARKHLWEGYFAEYERKVTFTRSVSVSQLHKIKQILENQNATVVIPVDEESAVEEVLANLENEV